jgi:PPOX class probable F420-dependent enzyme
MRYPETKPIPEKCRDILEDLPIGHVATIRPDGRLSVNPVCLMFDGKHIRVPTVKTRQKYKNLLADPRIAISVPHRNNPNRYVEVRGIAELTDDPDRAFVNSIARHYMNVDEYPFDKPGDERAILTIHAEQVSSPEIPLADAPPGAPDPDRRV